MTNIIFHICLKCEHINDYGFDKKYYLLGLYVNELLYKTSREGFDFDKIYKRYKDFLVILSNSSDSSNKLALFLKNFTSRFRL